jgi:hypothetical protein
MTLPFSFRAIFEIAVSQPELDMPEVRTQISFLILSIQT